MFFRLLNLHVEGLLLLLLVVKNYHSFYFWPSFNVQKLIPFSFLPWLQFFNWLIRIWSIPLLHISHMILLLLTLSSYSWIRHLIQNIPRFIVIMVMLLVIFMEGHLQLYMLFVVWNRFSFIDKCLADIELFFNLIVRLALYSFHHF